MKLAVEVVEKVTWTANEHIVHCNFPLLIVQSQLYAHKLNGHLIELVCLLAIGYRVANRLLNPLALEYMHQPNNAEENMQDDCKNSTNKCMRF